MDQTPLSLHPSLARHLVMVVEDDPAVRGSLKFDLELEGYTVETFDSAESLLADPWPERASCIVVDYHLPGLNGLQLLRALRDRHVSSPAVLITSHPDRNLRNAAAAENMAIVEKPLLSDALTREVSRVVLSRPELDDPD